MEYAKVYDVANESMKLFWLLPIPFILVLTGIMVYQVKKRKKGWGYEILKLSFMLLFVIGWGAIVGVHEISGYHKVQNILAQQNYQTVEGIVENFDPMPYTGHKDESFTVKGVNFKYSDFNENFYGLNNTKSHGGPITGNGQKVKIDYYQEKGRNYIFRLFIEK